MLAQVTNTHANSLLDLACGTGTLARMIKHEHPEMKVHGLDGDPDILELAHRKSREVDQDIHFDQGMSFAGIYHNSRV